MQRVLDDDVKNSGILLESNKKEKYWE